MDRAELIQFLEHWENMSLLFGDKELAREHFPLLIDIALAGDERINWRASWAADKINDMIPGIAGNYIPEMISLLPQLKHMGKKRQFLKFISLYPVPVDSAGFLFDFCINKLSSDSEDIAVRAYAMQIMYNISETEPDLKPELLQILEQIAEHHPSPGIIAKTLILSARLKKETGKMTRK